MHNSLPNAGSVGQPKTRRLIPKQALKPRRCQLGIAHRVLNRFMAKVGLRSAAMTLSKSNWPPITLGRSAGLDRAFSSVARFQTRHPSSCKPRRADVLTDSAPKSFRIGELALDNLLHVRLRRYAAIATINRHNRLRQDRTWRDNSAVRRLRLRPRTIFWPTHEGLPASHGRYGALGAEHGRCRPKGLHLRIRLLRVVRRSQSQIC